MRHDTIFWFPVRDFVALLRGRKERKLVPKKIDIFSMTFAGLYVEFTRGI